MVTFFWNHHHEPLTLVGEHHGALCHEARREAREAWPPSTVPLLLVALLARGGESFVPPQDCGGFGCVA